MQVELSPEALAAAEAVIATGRCGTVDEAVCLAFIALAGEEHGLDKFLIELEGDQGWLAEFQHTIQQGIEDADEGRTSVADHEFFEGIKRRGRERLALRRSIPA